MARYKDFDTAFAEKKGTPITFKYGGEEFELPAKIPAPAVLQVIRLQNDHESNADVPQSKLIDIAISLLGNDVLGRLMAKSISFDELTQIIEWVMSEYSGNEQEDEQGNVEAP
jgi:hypothetical protein